MGYTGYYQCTVCGLQNNVVNSANPTSQKPCGVEIKGMDIAATDDGKLPPSMAGALEGGVVASS